MSTTTSRLWSHTPDKKKCFWQESFWRLWEKERCFMLHYAFGHAFDLVILCSILPCFSWHILLQGQDFWVLQLIPHVLGQKLKFTIHLSLFAINIHCHYSLSLFTCYYSLRIFAYLRGVVPYISRKFWECLVQDFFPRESYHLWAFLWEISLLTTTSLHLYKACN